MWTFDGTGLAQPPESPTPQAAPMQRNAKIAALNLFQMHPNPHINHNEVAGVGAGTGTNGSCQMLNASMASFLLISCLCCFQIDVFVI